MVTSIYQFVTKDAIQKQRRRHKEQIAASPKLRRPHQWATFLAPYSVCPSAAPWTLSIKGFMEVHYLGLTDAVLTSAFGPSPISGWMRLRTESSSTLIVV